MKKLITPAFIVLTYSLLAQTSPHLKCSLGPVLEEKHSFLVSEIVGADESGVYVYGYSGGNIITKFDTSLQFEARQKIEPKIGKQYLSATFPLYFAGHLINCGMTYGTEKQTILHGIELDKSTLLPKGEVKQMGTSTRSSVGAYLVHSLDADPFAPNLINGFNYHISPSEKKLLICGIPGQTGSDPQEIDIAVYNTDLSKDWEKKFVIPFDNDLFKIEDVLVDDDGTAYVSGVLFNEKVKEKVKGKPNYEYVLIAFEPNQPSKTFKIASADHFIKSMVFFISKQTGIVGVGFYSDKGGSTATVSTVKGTISIAVEYSSGKVVEKSVKPFDADFLVNFMSERKAQSGKEVEDFVFRKLFLTEENRLVALAERIFISTSIGKEYANINFEDILTISVSPDLSIDWMTLIPKRQKTTLDPTASMHAFFSFSSLLKDDRLLILLNDQQENVGQKSADATQQFDHNTAVPMLVTVERNGTWSKSTMFADNETQLLILQAINYSPNDNEMYLYLQEPQGRLNLGKKGTRIAHIETH